jgi:hypothetical protein
MNQDDLLSRLAASENHAQQVQVRIRDQKRAIASLRSRGGDLSEAEQQLLNLERIQDEHLAEIERLKEALHHQK